MINFNGKLFDCVSKMNNVADKCIVYSEKCLVWIHVYEEENAVYLSASIISY